jgi:hypothetical protein
VIKAVIYELDTTATDGVMFLNESDNYTLQGNDLGSWIDIPFLAPIPLLNGFAYEFGVGGYMNPTDTSWIGVSGPMMYAGEHSSFDELGLSSQSNNLPTWYYTTKCPMVRMNFDPSSGPTSASNLQQTIFNVYPNPSNGLLTIAVDDNNTRYDVTVNNMLGQTVYSSSISMTTIVDLTNFDKGVYTVELKDEKATYTEKVVVE